MLTTLLFKCPRRLVGGCQEQQQTNMPPYGANKEKADDVEGRDGGRDENS